MSNAAGITVYGYSAPVTDVEAVELMKSAYSVSQTKDIAPFTIINLSENEQEQRKKWFDFYTDRMIMYCNKLEESILWKYPRVSLETIFDSILQQSPRKDGKPFKKFSSLEELQGFVQTISEFDLHI